MPIQCDFCGCMIDACHAIQISSPDMRLQVVDADTGKLLMEQGYQGSWAACPVCYPRIRDKQYDRILDDIMLAHPACSPGDTEFREFLASALYPLWDNLRVYL